jgi:hypothetical protein
MVYEFYFNLLLYELQMKKYQYITHAKYSHYKIIDKAKLQPALVVYHHEGVDHHYSP